MNLPTWAIDAVSGLPGLVTKEEAARFLKVSERTIATLCVSGKLKHVRRSPRGSSRVVIPRQFIAKYLVDNSEGMGREES